MLAIRAEHAFDGEGVLADGALVLIDDAARYAPTPARPDR
jgi:hypothetical protein